MPKNNKKDKVLYDFDYAEEEEKKKKKAEKKKSASKKHVKKGQAENQKKYDDEIIIGVTKIPDKEKPKKDVKKNRKKTKTKKKNKKDVEQEPIRNPIYNYDVDYIEEFAKEEKRKERNKKIAKAFKVFAGVAILAGIGAFAMLSPIFNVQTVQVAGNSKLSKDEIISVSGVNTNENIFRVFTTIIEKNVKQNPYVNTVTVHKKLPSTIEITVEERTPSFLIEFGNGYVYVNNQGYMLEISSQKLELPIITGLETKEEEYQSGARLVSADLEKLGTAIRIIDVANNNGIASLITSIDISNENNYKLYLETEKKTAYLGDCTNLETRMLYLVAIINNEKNVAGEAFIDMNLNSENAFFRESV